MSEYHKIQTVFKRDPETKHKTLLEGEFTLPEFEYLQNNKWIFTEKVDGTNIRIICPDYQEDGKAYGITFAGKTDRTQIPPPLEERLDEVFHSEKIRRKIADMFGDGCILYGEGHGAKIQKGGGNYRQDQDFVLFDVKVGDWWLNRADVEEIAAELGIDVVPVVGEGSLLEMVEQARAGIKSTWGDFQAEGYVARPAVEMQTRGGDRIITKIKCRDFNHGR